ncbi:MAG: hypothetical protein ABI305_05130 [Tepidiformaceae bacterium]
MHFLFVGGTKFVGLAAARMALAEGHQVTVAHSGEHEPPGFVAAHLHGTRDALLAPGGPVDAARPDVLVDTFAGGATAEKGRAVGEAGVRLEAKVVAVSSADVYQALVEAGLGDGTGQRLLSSQPLPIDEDSTLRAAAYPGAREGHDNVAMETALRETGANAAVLRPGAIYGAGDPLAREWPLVRRAKEGIRHLELPAAGVQIFHRVAVERVSSAILAAPEFAPGGFWPCNVVDPYFWTYAGLAAEIGRILDWEWEPESVSYAATKHPLQLATPAIFADRRLREVLRVTKPDPRAALELLVHEYCANGPAEGALYRDW